ncbi:MAG: hypothetical protein CMK59_08575, partial [Proteobacteria bacterium]|nr:hypothetical protein [Pseudomonadota bacterium]
MFALFLCALILPSQAVPVKLSQQGRLLDSSGGVMTGNHLLAFRFYDNQMGGSIVWEEILSVNFIEGYYSVILGADSANPLEDSMLAQGPLYIEIEVDGNGPVGMRQPVVSTPYARLAGTSENIDGGTVNASQISISGNLIVDQSGNWVGPTITLDWANIQGIPSEITNGDSDTLLGLNCNSGEIATWSGSSWECTSDNTLTDAEVDALVINGPIDLDSNSTLGGIPILTEGS